MKSFQRRRRGMSSQLTGSTIMKKIANVIVGKSMGENSFPPVRPKDGTALQEPCCDLPRCTMRARRSSMAAKSTR